MPTTGHTATSPSVGKVGTKKAVTANAHRLGQTDRHLDATGKTDKQPFTPAQKRFAKARKKLRKIFLVKVGKKFAHFRLDKIRNSHFVVKPCQIFSSSLSNCSLSLSLSLSLTLSHTHPYNLFLLSLSLCLANIIL